MRSFALLLIAALTTPALAQQRGVSVQVGTITTGTTLDVTAGSADGRSITMGIHAVNGALDGIDTFHNGPGGLGSGSLFASPMHQPYRPAQFGGIIIVDKDPKLLQTQIPELALKDTSLKAAVQKISDLTHTNLVLGIRGFQQANIDPAAPHTLTLPAGTIQDSLLALLETTAPKSPLVITTEDSVIQISTQAQADNDVATKSYYVEDVLANLPRFVSNQTDFEKLHDKNPPLLTAAGATQPAPKTSSTNIITIVTSSIRPEIWKINGGKIGEISLLNNRLIIRAPQSVHALLDGPKHFNPNAMPRYITYSP